MSAALLRAARALQHAVFDLVAAMPRFGEGARLRRVTWRRGKGEVDCFWTVDTVKPRADKRHGRAWGMLTWRGVAGPVREIRGVLKPLWESCDPPPPLSGPKL